MKIIIFTKDWQGYKKGAKLSVSEVNATNLIEKFKVAEYETKKKSKK